MAKFANTISFEDRAIAGQDMFWAARMEKASAASNGILIEIDDLIDCVGYADDGYDYDLADDDLIGGIRFN